MAPQPAVSSFQFHTISLARQLLVCGASNQLQMSGGLSHVHLSPLSPRDSHTGMPASLLFSHVNHSVGFCWLFLFLFFPPCSLTALAPEKRSLFHSLSHHDLPLSHAVQRFGYPTFHHYCLLMLVDAHKTKGEQLRSSCHLILLCCWRTVLQGRQWFSIFIKITPGCFAPLCLSSRWL